MHKGPEQYLFYNRISPHSGTVGGLLCDPAAFNPVPPDWSVIVTDIKDSTRAVADGRHETINLIATGCIVAVLNTLEPYRTEIPFFFGGDGATFLLPGALAPRVMEVLRNYQQRIREEFGLALRTGLVRVNEVYAAGESISIAKYAYPEALSIPVVLGNGMSYAERLIKGNEALMAQKPTKEQVPDLSGMQCRWDRIPPPEQKEEVVTLLVVAVAADRQHQLYARIMDFLDKQYGYLPSRRPLSESRLKMNATLSRLKNEMLAREGKVSRLALFKDWLTMLYGHIFFRTAKGKHYLRKLVEMSDTLVIDGKINTVISGGPTQRQALLAFLDDLEKRGDLYYGVHISSASIMSCYVRDLKDGHIHFVDGSEGGYTQAARMLKKKQE